MSGIIASLGVQDYIALAVIAAAVISAIAYLKKRRKKVCGGCGGCCSGCSGCSGCALADKCENKKENDNNGTENQLQDNTGKNTENL